MSKLVDLKILALLALGIMVISGCSDRYKEEYERGYQAGYTDGLNDAGKECEARLEDERSTCYSRMGSLSRSPSFTSTEVCGGGGVNVNGKHYPGGKTGCVRVFSNGKVERY
jgi:hypothetical protein